MKLFLLALVSLNLYAHEPGTILRECKAITARLDNRGMICGIEGQAAERAYQRYLDNKTDENYQKYHQASIKEAKCKKLASRICYQQFVGGRNN